MTRHTVASESDLRPVGKAIRAALEHGPVEVVIRPAEDARTAKQNRRYWAAIVGSLQDWLEQREGFRRDREVIHEWLKCEHFGQRVETLRGRTLMVPAHSRNLSKSQFSEYVDASEARIIEMGVPPEMIEGYADE